MPIKITSRPVQPKRPHYTRQRCCKHTFSLNGLARSLPHVFFKPESFSRVPTSAKKFVHFTDVQPLQGQDKRFTSNLNSFAQVFCISEAKVAVTY